MKKLLVSPMSPDLNVIFWVKCYSNTSSSLTALLDTVVISQHIIEQNWIAFFRDPYLYQLILRNNDVIINNNLL